LIDLIIKIRQQFLSYSADRRTKAKT